MFGVSEPSFGASEQLRSRLNQELNSAYPALEKIYQQIHSDPELSFLETNTAALVAKELKSLGVVVTEKVGRTGVVGVYTNGPGPTVLVRADMDALPLKEETGVPYASRKVMKDLQGVEQPVMHACAHDTHVTSLIGTARMLMSLKDHWSGTLVFVAQPAEEIAGGARAMLADGLYTRFPKPNYALALHTTSLLPAGTIGRVEGPMYAAVNSVDIVVRGIGGHGAAPHTTKDPIVLASQIVLAMQTIVSREIKPGTPAVVTVGTIKGGLKRNIISEEVKLELTLRAFDERVMDHLVAALRRVCDGLARAAGIPEDRLPTVTVTEESTSVTSNDVQLSRKLTQTFTEFFGKDRIVEMPPVTGGEDFAEYGRPEHKVVPCMWWVGGTDAKVIEEAHKKGVPVPSNHSPIFAPVPEPTLKACVTSMTAAVLELLKK
jgi:hippurate hydrolase